MSAHHHDETHSEMPFDHKLKKLLEHWIKHNTDHAVTYRNWAEKAKAKDIVEIADLFEDAARMSLKVNETFQQALALIHPDIT